MAKVMRKEARHMQRRDRASGAPWRFSSIYPQNQSLPTLLLCALTYTSDFMGGCPLPPLSEKVNFQLQLIKFLGMTRVFQPTNSFGSPLACLNRFFRPHVIIHSLPTMRGTGSLRYSNNAELLRELKLLNRTSRGFLC